MTSVFSRVRIMTSTRSRICTFQEFRVETNASSARYSRPATVVMSTKSGTNSFHGTAFETHRNSGFGVARKREQDNSRPAKLIRNEFGVSAGGPVMMPGYDGRNRTFWFAAWEASRTIQETNQAYRVPTMAMREGDFSALRLSDGTTPVLYDPWSTGTKEDNYRRLPFSDGGVMNKIPANRLSPLAKYLFSITPAPTTAANPVVADNWYGVFKAPSRSFNVSTRIDHRFSDFFNELNVSGYYNTYDSRPPVMAPPSGATWQEYLGLPNPFGSSYFPMLESLGLGSYAFRNNAPQIYRAAYLVVDDNATRLVGKHELQFGWHYRYNQSNQFPQQWFSEGIHNASTGATGLYDDAASTATNPVQLGRTGFELANLYIGVLNYSNNLNRGWYNLRERDYALYLHDTYKVTPRLTLTMGLRWEYWPVLRETGNALATYDTASKTVVLGQPLDTLYARGQTSASVIAQYQALGTKFTDWKTAGYPSTLMTGSKGDFGPRAGFAYRALDGKRSFVIRGA